MEEIIKMVTLKCLENFTPSKSNIYSEEEMIEINTNVLAERGVSINDIALLAYGAQSKYVKDLTLDECLDSVKHILSKRDQFHAIIFAANVDMLAEQNLLMEPLLGIIKDDLGLFGIDEAIAISIAGNYGTIGVTNFGNLDVNKPGKISILQNDRTHVHCLMDDVVGAIAAVSAIRIAQARAVFDATGKFPLL
jgi:phosphatidylglycerophosphatase A